VKVIKLGNNAERVWYILYFTVSSHANYYILQQYPVAMQASRSYMSKESVTCFNGLSMLIDCKSQQTIARSDYELVQ